MSLSGLVVGAAGGVGSEVVRQMLTTGYRVTGTVLNEDEAATVRKQTAGVEQILVLDLANADNVVETLRASLDEVNAVVVCAAISPYGPLEIAPLAGFRRTMEINTVSGLAVYQATMPLLRASKGRLVLISSFAGKVSLPFIGHYVASKHALEGLGDVMRYEAKSFGVDVILIEPGSIKTPMVSNQLNTLGRDRQALSAEDARLYGEMYDNFSRLAGQGWETMMMPSVVAEVVLDALHAPNPQARYQVGDDSKYLCDVARKTDSEIDAIIDGFWGG